ncbi:hypothetical protein D3C72_1612600 [compost metagenome]
MLMNLINTPQHTEHHQCVFRINNAILLIITQKLTVLGASYAKTGEKLPLRTGI